MTPPVQPQVPQLPATVDLNMRIAQGDQRFPSELWGRTIGEAMRFYQIMRQDFVARQNELRNQPQLAGQPAAQPLAQPAQLPTPVYQPPRYAAPAPQPPQAPTGYPSLDEIEERITSAMSRAMGPVNKVSGEAVYHQIRTQYHDWHLYDQDILASLQGADPSALLNPEIWRSAYFFAKGKKLTEAPPAVNVPAYSGDPFNRAAPDTRGQPIITPPPPPPPSWFSESSTAPGGPAGASNLDPMDEIMARKFGIPVEEYRAFKGGNVPPMPAPAAGQPAIPGPQSNGRW